MLLSVLTAVVIVKGGGDLPAELYQRRAEGGDCGDVIGIWC